MVRQHFYCTESLPSPLGTNLASVLRSLRPFRPKLRQEKCYQSSLAILSIKTKCLCPQKQTRLSSEIAKLLKIGSVIRASTGRVTKVWKQRKCIRRNDPAEVFSLLARDGTTSFDLLRGCKPRRRDEGC